VASAAKRCRAALVRTELRADRHTKFVVELDHQLPPRRATQVLARSESARRIEHDAAADHWLAFGSSREGYPPHILVVGQPLERLSLTIRKLYRR
jgi:hypothetical protein